MGARLEMRCDVPLQVFGDMPITIITKRMLRGEDIRVVGSRRFALISYCPETSVARSCAVVMVKCYIVHFTVCMYTIVRSVLLSNINQNTWLQKKQKRKNVHEDCEVESQRWGRVQFTSDCAAKGRISPSGDTATVYCARARAAGTRARTC